MTELGGLVLDGKVRVDDDRKEHVEQDEEHDEDEQEEEERTEDWVGVVHQRHVEVSEQDTKQREPDSSRRRDNNITSSMSKQDVCTALYNQCDS